MKILVSISVSSGELVSPLFPRTKYASLIIRGPETVQDLREADCSVYRESLCKWLASITLENSVIHPECFDKLISDFAIRLGDANTFGTIWPREQALIELTAVFTNMEVRSCVLPHNVDSLKELTKGITLPDAWQD